VLLFEKDGTKIKPPPILDSDFGGGSIWDVGFRIWDWRVNEKLPAERSNFGF
jgi:hypothetical protein